MTNLEMARMGAAICQHAAACSATFHPRVLLSDPPRTDSNLVCFCIPCRKPTFSSNAENEVPVNPQTRILDDRVLYASIKRNDYSFSQIRHILLIY